MLLNFFDESIVARLTSDAAMELPKLHTIPGAFDDVPPQAVSLPCPIPVMRVTVLKSREDRECPSDDPYQYVY